MAKNRLIASDIWADDWFGPLPFFEQALWIGLFSQCADDQGRLLDNPVLIRAWVFPYKDIAMVDIVKALALFERDGKIHRYQADGKKLIQIVNWWDHQHAQWVQPSQWPSPEVWHDAVRTRMNGTYLSENWDGLRGFQVVPSGDMAPEQTPIVAPERATLPTHLGGQDPDPDPNPDPNPGIATGADAPAPAEPSATPFDDPPEPEEPEPAPKPRRVRARTPKPAPVPVYPPGEEPIDAHHPAIECFRAVTGRFPVKSQWAEIARVLGGDPDQPRLRRCFVAWEGKGFKPTNLGWLYEWYVDGIPKGPPNGHGPGPVNPTREMLKRRMAEALAEEAANGQQGHAH